MGLKNYIIATILLMVIVYGFVHSLELSAYTLTIFGNSWTMPAELWILVPVLLLALLTYIHLAFYTLLENIKSRFLKQDIKSIFDLIKIKLMEEDKKVSFKTKEFKELSTILNNINFDLKSTIANFSNEELNSAIRTINDINAGAYIKDLKSKSDSNLYERNIKNRIKEDADFAIEVVKKSDKYSYDLQKTALLKIIEAKSLTSVKKAYAHVKLDKELVIAILKKDIETDDFSLGYEEVIRILKDLKLTKSDFVEIAKLYEGSEKPDILILLFEKLSNENEDATEAYLYVLNKFEMKDKLREFLVGSADDEYVAFKALLDLKDAGKLYSLESISYK